MNSALYTLSDISLLRSLPASTDPPVGLTREQQARVEDLPWGLVRGGRRTELGDYVVALVAEREARAADNEQAIRVALFDLPIGIRRDEETGDLRFDLLGQRVGDRDPILAVCAALIAAVGVAEALSERSTS